MQTVYHCKKIGRDYVYESAPGTVLNSVQDEYSWVYGVNLYADRYHASMTREGKNAWTGTDAEFTSKVDAMCIEARDRWHAGDVRTRGAESPATIAIRKVAIKSGLTEAEFTAIGESDDPATAFLELLASKKKKSKVA